MSLSLKTNDELRKLLDEYGIKHGPVVDSTRKQYEKKLEAAMTEKTASEKPYYRKEEETSQITYRSPYGEEGYVDTLIRRGITERHDDNNLNQDKDHFESMIQFQRRTYNQSVHQSSVQYGRPPIRPGRKWKLVWLLLLLAVLAGLFYAYWYLWK